MEGLIFDIKRFAIHDGPGLRTTIFFKGCPLDCWWCHNPESKKPVSECFKIKQSLGEKDFFAEKKIGEYFTINQILTELEKQKVFMQEGNGGVTLSGGEPLMQPDFSIELLKKCKQTGLHTAVDTTGFVSWEKLDKVSEVTNLFLYDIKLVNKNRHLKYTGVENTLILNNFKLLAKKGVPLVARIPLIPGINTDEDSISDLLDFLLPLKNENFHELNLLPYHHIGTSKYQRFKQSFRMGNTNEPNAESLKSISSIFEKEGFKVIIEN